MSHYLGDEVKSAVLGTIKITRIFADYWRRIAKYGGALQLENRLLDNDEVWDVLAYMGRPQSKLEMERRLGQSVWDPRSFQNFKNNRAYIQNHMDEYLHAYLHYEERFKLLIDILHHEDTAKFFPPFVVRKQGKLGLIDYYLQGTPDVVFSRQVMDKYIPALPLQRCKEFPVFLRLYLEALMVVRDACKGLEDTVALFKTEKRSIFTPPPEPAYMKEKVFNKKSDRVQFVDSVAHSSQDDLMFDENDNGPDRERLLDEMSGDDLEDENDDNEMNAEESAEYDDEQIDRDVIQDEEKPTTNGRDSWLMNVRFDEKRPKVCFEFANNKTCKIMEATGKCKYSHHSDDVKNYSLMGPKAVGNLVKSFSPQQHSNTHSDTPPKYASKASRRS